MRGALHSATAAGIVGGDESKQPETAHAAESNQIQHIERLSMTQFDHLTCSQELQNRVHLEVRRQTDQWLEAPAAARKMHKHEESSTSI